MNHYVNIPAPNPIVQAEFHVEPHPDPTVRALIEKVERLQRENEELRAAAALRHHLGAE